MKLRSAVLPPDDRTSRRQTNSSHVSKDPFVAKNFHGLEDNNVSEPHFLPLPVQMESVVEEESPLSQASFACSPLQEIGTLSGRYCKVCEATTVNGEDFNSSISISHILSYVIPLVEHLSHQGVVHRSGSPSSDLWAESWHSLSPRRERREGYCGKRSWSPLTCLLRLDKHTYKRFFFYKCLRIGNFCRNKNDIIRLMSNIDT